MKEPLFCPTCSHFADEEVGPPKKEGSGDSPARWRGSVTLLNTGGQELGASWAALQGGLGPEGGAHGRKGGTPDLGLALLELELSTAGWFPAAGARAPMTPCHSPIIPG